MPEVKLMDWTKSDIELIETEQLSLIGFVDMPGLAGHYPTPLLALEGKPKITYDHEASATLVHGIIPAIHAPRRADFIKNSPAGIVRLMGINAYGMGRVALGNTAASPEVDGYVLRIPVSYDPKKELAFVSEYDASAVIDPKIFKNPNYTLAYDLPEVIVRLGKLGTNSK